MSSEYQCSHTESETYYSTSKIPKKPKLATPQNPEEARAVKCYRALNLSSIKITLTSSIQLLVTQREDKIF